MQGNRNESGIALIVTLLTLTVFALMMLGFFFMVNGQQQIAGSERDNTIAFYGAEAALENMSFQVANLFAHTTSPTPAQLTVLDGEPPAIPGVTFPSVGAGMPNGGYFIGYTPNGSGGILSNAGTIGGTGPLAGLQGAITPLTLTAIAEGPNNTEVKLIRQVQEVDVPVFEFGIFSNNDLSFFAGPDFSFGGRVATNGNLYLAEGSGSTLTFPDKVTAFGDVIRTQLANGFSTSSGYPGTVNVVTSPGSSRSLAQNEGSLVGGPGSAPTSNWKTISLTDYNGNLENAATGVKVLNMSFAVPGSGNQPINIIERAPLTEDPTSALGQARLENQASMRILLSDSTADLPDGGNAVSLSTAFPSTWYPSDSCHAALAVSPGPLQDTDFLTPAGTPLLGGFIEVDIENAAGAWVNVTTAVLSQGITNDNPAPGLPCLAGGKPYYPILHLEEVNSYGCVPGLCLSPASYIPINLYDTREGNARDVNDGTIHSGGVMNLVELDVRDLQWWLANNATGQQVTTNNAYIVYFSDRRGNFDPGAPSTNYETGMYGNEDIINPASSTGTPDSQMEEPEDVDGPNANTSTWGSDTFDTYGARPSCASASSPLYPCVGSAPLNGSATPQATVSAGQAEKNRVIFFRHALRLVDGSLGSLPPLSTANCSIIQGASGSGGFTVAAENPVYVEGNYNANAAGGVSFNDVSAANQCHVPAAVMGDAVTLLSNNWSDRESFNTPTNSGSRPAVVTYYRTAIMGGTTIPFARPTGYATYQDFGTDGGVHNFLRMLESWGGQTLYYKGSIADFYYSRQATGVYKDGLVNSVYSPPSRGYSFDIDFESLATLPPGTPRFTTVNALGFQQVVQAK